MKHVANTPAIIKEIIANMHKIEALAETMTKPNVTAEQLQHGLEVSRKATSQPEMVEMTPLFKNALSKIDRYGDGQKLKVHDDETKAEKWFKHAVEVILTKDFGTSKVYDENKPLLSVDHYNVQCWQNFKENWRDIQPGQAEERVEVSKKYSVETSAEMVYQLLLNDKLFQKAVMLVLEQLPSVRASEEFLEVNLPFMTKHTNVGFPYWSNDRNLSPDGRTYAEVTMDIAKSITDPRKLFDYNVSTEFGRNQRGKGRFLVAISRIVNLWLNRLEAKEIEAYKAKSAYFVGYGDDEQLRTALEKMVEDCNKMGLKMRNMDQSRYDQHVSKGFILLLGAMSILKCNGARSKEIALYRAALATKTWLVDGLQMSYSEIYGRIFSGFIDTNRGGGIINAVITTYCCMKQDPNYSSYIYDLIYYMLVMGDDNCFVYKILNHETMVKDMKELNFDVNPSKDEYGPMFLQWRLFEDPETHKLVMAYAWTRVLRSMLFKETGKGLGPAGWTLAFWQQLAKLIDYPKALRIVVNLIVPFDTEKLMMDRPVSEIIRMTQDEDRKKMEEQRTKKQRNRVTSTRDALYDGDPQKQRFAEALETNDAKGYLADLQSKIRDVYDPSFLAKYGLRVPA